MSGQTTYRVTVQNLNSGTRVAVSVVAPSPDAAGLIARETVTTEHGWRHMLVYHVEAVRA